MAETICPGGQLQVKMWVAGGYRGERSPPQRGFCLAGPFYLRLDAG